MRNDFIAHSYKGSTWKDHLYDKKVGSRYFYSKSSAPRNYADEIVGTPDFEGLAYELGKIKIVQAIRDFMNVPIWSPNPEMETLVSKGKDRIASLFNKRKDTMLTTTKKRK